VWLHLAGDTLGALVAVFAAIAIRLGGSPRVDPVGSLFVAVILALGAARLLRDAALVLLDAAPHHLPARTVRDVVRTETGVVDVVQLRVWTLGAGHDAAAVHVRAALHDASLATRIHDRLRDALGIEFVTVEVTHDAAEETVQGFQSSRTI
jgi:cobalt-zinc-cadmium efflux system protein